ncbi:MAG: SOS response-associated peptidase [Actinobacteria bacterium]|nr:SOS response-associated peptidase [Actinomycetota bacterium]MBI3686657.1 SOS response-associated peptidase [Actinomycetota bacterium]
MCGRYAAGRSTDELADAFDAVDRTADEVGASFNVAPGTAVRAVVASPPAQPDQPDQPGGSRRRELRALRWGLVPPWADRPQVGARMINARVETVAGKPVFRGPLAARRCLVPADGWFEWRDRRPYFITPDDGSVLALAGLYEHWNRGPEPLTSCAIITTAAVGRLTEVHDRMPLLIPAARWSEWLDPDCPVEELLAPSSLAMVARLAIRPVGPAVGDVRRDGRELIVEVPPPSTLF